MDNISIRLKMCAQGIGIKDLARRMFISESSLYRKLQFPDQFKPLELKVLKKSKLL